MFMTGVLCTVCGAQVYLNVWFTYESHLWLSDHVNRQNLHFKQMNVQPCKYLIKKIHVPVNEKSVEGTFLE